MAPKFQIFCFVDHSHTATTECFDNPVMRDRLPLERQNRRVVVIRGDGLRNNGDGCSIQEALWCVAVAKQGFYFQAKMLVFPTRPLKKKTALSFGQV